ncbi:LuxR family transcriptional regulator [Rhizobium sp. AC44/96]|jgi:DNA-binding CsgD family transcriptional regulator|uniref:helix-turn-helix transcriptional regulator n=1 Tax=unclassified Rhizobium TaxID=2613769 RepID=UPI00080FA00F|nr:MULTISPECIES: LuxR family transcriptional regulator [unclassified Rhizobium]MDM9621676.1 LuxR C-terminal-related transcriptional regulator [Rhizobium sp. S96]OCJ16256.1 LuxR family transcriptional regulator [Rhizobium sp. AC44/96]
MSYVSTSERQSFLTTEATDVKTRPALGQFFAKIATAFGFNYITLMDAPSPDNILLKPLLIETSLPNAYVNQFDRSRFMQLPLFATGMKDSVLPRLWNLADPACIFPPELQALKRDYGMVVGVAIPVHSIEGHRLLFWLGGDRAPLGQTEINELTMVILHALDAYNRVKRAKSVEHPPLSAREREVVRWTAQGKTSIEIGQILSLSDHTINAYMTSAIKKLDCVNRTQLVAKAIRLQLIS